MAREHNTAAEGNLVTYIKEQVASFTEVPLGEVDSLVLSVMSYFCYDEGVMGKRPFESRVPLPVALCGVPTADLMGNSTFMQASGEEVLNALLQSPRFMELEVSFYAFELSQEQEKQFCGVTFFLPDGSICVVFKGSDDTLVGWKENFNLSFMKAVPSQLTAQSYLEYVAQSCEGPLFVMGHSKGGNLAEYAVLTCSDEVYERVVKVYCLDGPGFAEQPSERIASADYNAKLCKIVPGSSVVGMIMENRPTSVYAPIRATGILVYQHLPTQWVVKDGSFVKLSRLNEEAIIIANTINSWAALYEPKQRELFFDAIFGVLWDAGTQVWSDSDSLVTKISIALATMKLPSEMRKTVVNMVKDVAGVLKDEAVRRVRDITHGNNRERPV